MTRNLRDVVCGKGSAVSILAPMRKKLCVVTLTEEQGEQLQELIAAGTAPARKLIHARTLLKADQSPGGLVWVDWAIAEAVEVNQPTVVRILRQFIKQGLEAALNHRLPKRDYQRKLDGAQEARLIALACSAPPSRHGRWSLQLLAERLAEFGGSGGYLVPDGPRENLLEVYTQPDDPKRPVVSDLHTGDGTYPLTIAQNCSRAIWRIRLTLG